ncbi:hypothetical protein JTE90_011929 [Oedothorax gibbosus]|uniref:DNA polymerase zeta catalytic subunit n=1 Tax=Oedothorax gibbosus TaxID=931172 RepID=A0AAV6V274_9ARAC|nr:hypothetical protein JTE90_011929 [Oedothorax gibbosus]
MFSLRLLTVDHYMSTPIKDLDCLYSEFRSSEIHKVPVVRIFGVTPAGQKACLHVHRIFPYLLLRWKDVFPGIEIKDSYKYLQELALEIDKSLHVAARSSNSTKHHVFKIDTTKGLSFYGYYENEEEFLKIYFYNPYDVSKTSELLTNGAIFNKCIQPHQAHFPFHLQFMSDFNLSGMNLINISQFKFRALNNTNTSEPSLPRDQSLSSLLDDSTNSEDKFWNIGIISSSQISTIPKQSHCELEIDCCDTNIMNKIDRTRDVGENPGIAAIWTEERVRRLANNDTSPLTPVPSQDRLKAFETPSDTHFKEMARKFLFSQKCEVPLQSNEADIDSSIDSLYTYQSSYDSMTLSNTQDKDLLKDLITMANGKNAENDSILGFEVESDSEEETILMSQRLDTEPWCSLEQRAISSPPLFEKSGEIPQLDGANDDDEDFQKSGPKMLKEEKKESANTTNASTGFDKETPVLQTEKNSHSGTSSDELQLTTSLQFPKHRLMQCSVKLQRYSILENTDSTKPVLLADFEENVNKSLSTSKKSSQKLFKYSDREDCQRKKHKNSLPKICVENNKIIKKSKEVRPSVVKCVKEVVGDVVKILEKSGKVHLLNSELKISKINHKKVSSKSHSVPQSITKTNSCDISKVKNNQDEKLLKNVPSQHKDFTKDTQTNYDKFDNIKLKLNHKSCATSRTPKFKSDSVPSSGIDKNLVSKSQTKSSSLKMSNLIDVRHKELNSQSLNANTDFVKAGKKDTSLVLSKSKSSPNETLPSKSFINNSSSGKAEKTKTIHPQKGKSFNLELKNHLIKDFDPVNTIEARLDFSKIGKEIVPLKKLPDETIRQYENPKAASSVGNKEKCKQNDTNLLKPQLLDKSKKDFQKIKVTTNVSLKTKHLGKLSFEKSKSAGSRSLSSHKFDFPETCIESKSPVIKPNNKKQSMLTSSNNDVSDFKSSSRKHASKTKFNNKSKSLVQHLKNSVQSHQRQKQKLPITNQKTDSMPSKVQRNIGESKMTRKPEVKNIIEEQVKQSLEVSAWDEEVAFIGMKAKCSSAEVIDISLSSDEDEIQPSVNQNNILNKTVTEYNSCLQRKLFVPLKPCDDLIKEFYPNSESKMLNGILANESKGKRISEMKKIKSSETASRGLFNSVQIKQELIWEQEKKEFNKKSNKLIPDLCKIGLVKIKTEPLFDKETSIIKKNLSLNSSMDNLLQPKAILPYAVKSKPTLKPIEKSILENGTKTNIFAVKSLPKVKVFDNSKTNKVNTTFKNSGIANSVLSSSSSTINSKLQTKNKSSLPSNTKHCGDKSFEDINDTTIANGKFTNHLLKSKLSNKTVTLLPASDVKDNKTSKTACQNDKTEIKGGSNTRKSIVSQNNSTTHKLMNSFPSNKAEEQKQNYKHKKGEGSSCNKNQKALSKSENTQSQKRTFVKSFGKSNVTSSPSTDNTPTKNSASNISHSINSIIKKDSHSKFIPEKTIITKETIRETAKILENDSNSLDFSISANILSRDTESENQGPIVNKIFSQTKIIQSESNVLHKSSTVAEIKIPMNVETTVVSEESKCNTINNLADIETIISSDLYDTVKRRKTRLNSKTSILDSTDTKVLSENYKTLTADSKLTRNSATTSKPDALIANSKTSKLTRNSTITSKPDTSSSSKMNYVPQSVDTKSFTLKVKYNAETEPEVSSIDKSSVFSADTPVIISREKRISPRKSRGKDLVQLNSEKPESSLSLDSPSNIKSTNEKDKPPENSISFPKRQASKRGRDDNNFGFFSNKTSKRRRNCQGTTVNPKPLSSKLSLEANVAQNNKYEGNTIENLIKQEIFEEEKMGDALSRFDFDENASIEPTFSASYSSRRSKNKGPRGKNKTLSVKSLKKPKKNLNIEKNKKDINFKTTKSNQLNFSKNQPRNEMTPVKNNKSKLEPIHKSPTIKLKRNSYGEICVVNPTINQAISTSISEVETDFLSPPKSKGMRPGNIIKSDLEGKPSIKLKICLEKKECVIINSDSESETDDQPKAMPKRRSSRTKSEPLVNPCEPIVPPILIKNIKKEKLDDYEQQPYIAPLKLKLNIQNVNNCNRIDLSKPKCEPIKLCRNADHFYISPTASNHPQNEMNPKRRRGRPRKNGKHESPSKIETSNVIDKISILKIPKLSLTGFSENDISAKPLSRKTRSNSARADFSYDWANVKIKKEPLSEEEYIPSAVSSELSTPSAIKTRRRSSLKCENFKKFFDSDSEDSELKITKAHSPRKKKSMEETKNRTNIKLSTNKSAESDECQVVYSSLPEKPKRLRKKRNSSPSKRKSCSVNNAKVMDVTKNNLPECTVNLRRLPSAFIDKHLLVSHSENNEKERESVSLAPIVTEVQNSVLENFKESSTKLNTHVNQVVNKKFFEGNYQINSLSQRQIKNLDRDDVFLENHKTAYNTPIEVRNLDTTVNLNTMAQPESSPENKIVNSAIATPSNSPNQDSPLSVTSSIEREKDSGVPSFFVKGNGTYGGHIWDSPVLCGNHDSPQGGQTSPPDLNQAMPLKVNSNLQTNDTHISKPGVPNSRVSYTTKGTESPVLPKLKNVEGNMFDKVTLKMKNAVHPQNDIFNNSQSKHYFSDNSLISLSNTQKSPYNALEDINKASLNKTNPNNQLLFKSIQEDFERSQDNQAVSCFKGYDLLSETGTMPPASSHMLKTLSREQSQSSYSHPRINKQNSVDSNEILESIFSIQENENKYSNTFCNQKSNFHENQNTNVFGAAQWPSVSTPFYSHDLFSHGPTSNAPLPINKSDACENKLEISSHELFPKQQFNNEEISYLPNIFSSEKANANNTFSEDTKAIPNEQISSPIDNYSTEMSNSDATLLHPSFEKLPVSHYSSKVLTTESGSGSYSNSYDDANKQSATALSDDDAEKTLKSLSDVLAGSALDVDNDSVSINCDIYSTSLEKTTTENIPVSNITESQNKSEALTSTVSDKEVIPVNKYEDSKFSQQNHFPTLDFTCLTENNIDHNLLDFDDIAYHSPTIEANVSISTEKKSHPNSFVATDTKSNNNNIISDVKESNTLLKNTLSNTSSNLTTIISSSNASAPFELCFGNNMPLVSLTNQPSNPCFQQLSMQAFNSVDQSFVPTLMVKESVLVPAPNFFLGNASIANEDSVSKDIVSTLPISASDNATVESDSKSSSDQGVGKFKQCINVDNIMDECGISVAYMSSPVVDTNENQSNIVDDETAADNMILSFYGNDTLIDLNQTQTFSSTLQNRNTTISATDLHVDNVISSSHFSVSSTTNNPVPELVNQTVAEDNSCGLPVNEINRVIQIPRIPKHSVFAHKSDVSNDSLSFSGVTKKRKKGKEMNEVFNDGSQSSTYKKTSQSLSFSYEMNKNVLNNHQEKLQTLISTPANPHGIRNFLSDQLGVSPINNNILLNVETKKKKRLFDKKSVPYDKKSDTDTTTGGYKRFWENNSLTSRGLGSEKNLSNSDIDGPTLENSRGYKVNVDDMGEGRVRQEGNSK